MFVSSLPCSHRAGVCDEVSAFGLLIAVCSPLDRQLDERTLVYFVDNSLKILQAYVDNGEGFDRAGGFAVQVRFDSIVLCPYKYT